MRSAWVLGAIIAVILANSFSVLLEEHDPDHTLPFLREPERVLSSFHKFVQNWHTWVATTIGRYRYHSYMAAPEHESCPFAASYRAPFLLVSDLDRSSKSPSEFRWEANLKRGLLEATDDCTFRIRWAGVQTVEAWTSFQNRSMELSELVVWDNDVLAFCDITGIVYKVDLRTNLALPRFTLCRGNGKSPYPFKSEWATVKDGLLYVGSVGQEWIGKDGEIEHHDVEWVKTIDPCGSIHNIDWINNYQRLRAAANATKPGYLMHEAAVWHPAWRRWLFFPRRRSFHTPYDSAVDERMGTSIALIASEYFEQIDVIKIGDIDPLWGFTSVKRLPATNVFIGLQALEVDGETASRLVVFDLHGRFYLDGDTHQLVSNDEKYEGITFL